MRAKACSRARVGVVVTNPILFTLLCSLSTFYEEAAMNMQPGVFA